MSTDSTGFNFFAECHFMLNIFPFILTATSMTIRRILSSFEPAFILVLGILIGLFLGRFQNSTLESNHVNDPRSRTKPPRKPPDKRRWTRQSKDALLILGHVFAIVIERHHYFVSNILSEGEMKDYFKSRSDDNQFPLSVNKEQCPQIL